MAFNTQVLERVMQLEDMGLINGNLAQYYFLDNTNQSFFRTVLQTFCGETTADLHMMQAILNDDVIDLEDLYEVCIKMAGSTKSVGALLMQDACSDLSEATIDCSIDRCISAVGDIRNAFHAVQTHFNEILQLF